MIIHLLDEAEMQIFFTPCLTLSSAVSQFWSQKLRNQKKLKQRILAGNNIGEVKLAAEFKNCIFIAI